MFDKWHTVNTQKKSLETSHGKIILSIASNCQSQVL